MKDIILITGKYPFGNGETYIAPELEFAHNSVRISIVPMSEDKNGCRELPDNVRLLSLEHSKNNKVCLLLQTLFSKQLFKGVLELLSQNKISVLSMKELFKFVYASKVHYKNLLKTLRKNYDFSKVTFYSYWMDSTSLSISYFRKYGAKTVTRCHGGDLYDERLPWKHQFLRKYIVEHLDYVCPVSVHGKEYLDNRIGVHNNVVPIHLGIQDNGVGKYHNDELPIIVSCSSVIPLKRIDLLINALSMVKTNYKWIHFGDGIDLEKIRKLAAEKLNNNSYEFLGNRPNREIGEFYKNSNVRMFINVSFTEGIPVSIMEALSYGIPIIATDVGGVSEQIRSGYNGELVDENISFEDLAVTVDNMLTKDDTEYFKLRENARCSYEKNWNYNTNYSKFYSIV